MTSKGRFSIAAGRKPNNRPAAAFASTTRSRASTAITPSIMPPSAVDLALGSLAELSHARTE
jgi:hypothetical protein